MPETLAQKISCEFCKMSTSFHRTPLVAASNFFFFHGTPRVAGSTPAFFKMLLVN